MRKCTSFSKGIIIEPTDRFPSTIYSQLRVFLSLKKNWCWTLLDIYPNESNWIKNFGLIESWNLFQYPALVNNNRIFMFAWTISLKPQRTYFIWPVDPLAAITRVPVKDHWSPPSPSALTYTNSLDTKTSLRRASNSVFFHWLPLSLSHLTFLPLCCWSFLRNVLVRQVVVLTGGVAWLDISYSSPVASLSSIISLLTSPGERWTTAFICVIFPHALSVYVLVYTDSLNHSAVSRTPNWVFIRTYWCLKVFTLILIHQVLSLMLSSCFFLCFVFVCLWDNEQTLMAGLHCLKDVLKRVFWKLSFFFPPYQSSIILNAVFPLTPSISVILSLSFSSAEPLLMHSWPLIKMLYIVRKCICSGSGWRLSGWQEMSLWLSASSAIPRGRRLGQSESSLHLMEYGYFTPKLLATITWCEGRTGFVYLCAVRGVWGVFWWVVDVCVCVCSHLHPCVMGWWFVSISMCVRDQAARGAAGEDGEAGGFWALILIRYRWWCLCSSVVQSRRMRGLD